MTIGEPTPPPRSGHPPHNSSSPQDTRRTTSHSNQLPSSCTSGVAQRKSANPHASLEKVSEPGYYDVLLGRGRTFENHVGNQHFHDLITVNIDNYVASNVQLGKWKITMDIVEAVLVKGGRFLRPPPPSNIKEGWTVVSVETARQKVAHSLQYHQRRLTNLTKEVAEAATSSPTSSEKELKSAPSSLPSTTAAKKPVVQNLDDLKHRSTADLLDMSLRNMTPLPSLKKGKTEDTDDGDNEADSLVDIADDSDERGSTCASPPPMTMKSLKTAHMSRRVSTDLRSETPISSQPTNDDNDDNGALGHFKSRPSPIPPTPQSSRIMSQGEFRSPPSQATLRSTSNYPPPPTPSSIASTRTMNNLDNMNLSMDTSASSVVTASATQALKSPPVPIVTPEHADFATMSSPMSKQHRSFASRHGAHPQDPITVMMMQGSGGRSFTFPVSPSHGTVVAARGDHEFPVMPSPSNRHVRPASGFVKRAFAHNGSGHEGDDLSFQGNERPQQPPRASPTPQNRAPPQFHHIGGRMVSHNSPHWSGRLARPYQQQQRRAFSLPLFDSSRMDGGVQGAGMAPFQAHRHPQRQHHPRHAGSFEMDPQMVMDRRSRMNPMMMDAALYGADDVVDGLEEEMMANAMMNEEYARMMQGAGSGAGAPDFHGKLQRFGSGGGSMPQRRNIRPPQLKAYASDFELHAMDQRQLSLNNMFPFNRGHFIGPPGPTGRMMHEDLDDDLTVNQGSNHFHPSRRSMSHPGRLQPPMAQDMGYDGHLGRDELDEYEIMIMRMQQRQQRGFHRGNAANQMPNMLSSMSNAGYHEDFIADGPVRKRRFPFNKSNSEGQNHFSTRTQCSDTMYQPQQPSHHSPVKEKSRPPTPFFAVGLGDDSDVNFGISEATLSEEPNNALSALMNQPLEDDFFIGSQEIMPNSDGFPISGPSNDGNELYGDVPWNDDSNPLPSQLDLYDTLDDPNEQHHTVTDGPGLEIDAVDDWTLPPAKAA